MVKKLPSGLPYASGYQLQGVLQTGYSPIANTPCKISNHCVGVIIGGATGIFLRITLDKPIYGCGISIVCLQISANMNIIVLLS